MEACSPLKLSDSFTQITLESETGVLREWPLKIAEQSITIKNLIQDVGVAAKIPLPNVSVEELDFIRRWYEEELCDTKKKKKNDDEWKSRFLKTHLTPIQMQRMLQTSNYLDSESLYSQLVKVIAADVTALCVENMHARPADYLDVYFGGALDCEMPSEEELRLEAPWLFLAVPPTEEEIADANRQAALGAIDM